LKPALDDRQEKLARLSEAIAYFLVNTSRAIYIKLGSILSGEASNEGNRKDT
jgi:hypothetical protein